MAAHYGLLIFPFPSVFVVEVSVLQRLIKQKMEYQRKNRQKKRLSLALSQEIQVGGNVLNDFN